MRKPVILTLVWGLLVICMSLRAQESIDFSRSISPGTLSSEVLSDQLDTTNLYRHTVALATVQDDFPNADRVSIETYYQKSGDHHLLELSKASMPIQRTYLVSEGLGTTYWKVSDGSCWVLLSQATTKTDQQLELMDRGCLE